ncbi:MAG TPA: nicotinamide-nucleotide adenylyltransferase [Methanocorpusculum sp.]|nr:nicotinamide-nucleotide adenylyltransferase [Methanocorpusculum sp.]HJJ39845.1 nicotinamide-nucleotide adenylyltransferase [Methanocorpusculum sp.]HJJ49202.1 nicotinamide-nucleotide adenylyltransferase [Methanocorpusculum sp.]HJJ56860.1 nicotinamide-nucleotide adenylyltransferase [Methanocorpusculum sp.]
MIRGLYMGRFQPFHNGHKAVVELISKEVDELIIGIGSAQMSHELQHPFTAGERIEMITRALKNIDIPFYVIPIEDINRNAVWVAHVVSLVPSFNVVYSSNPQVVRLFKENGYSVKSPEMFSRGELSGTIIREKMISGKEWESSVPEAAAAVIKEVDGVARIQQLASSDE